MKNEPNSRGLELHIKAERARELGWFIESLKFADEAIVFYQEEKNYFGMSDAMCSKVLTFRHLFEKSKDKKYLILAKFAGEAAVEINKSSISLTRLGQAYKSLEDWDMASQKLEEAITEFEKNPPELHNRPAVLFDMKNQLYACQYRNGNEEALNKMLENISELEKTEELKYNKDVWLSGAHMEIAEMTNSKDKNLSKSHFEKAKEIIDNNKELILRKKQLEALNEKLAF